jgi:hypothetical protein
MASDESKQEISRLYYNNLGINEAIESIRDLNISFELVKTIYDQLSKEDEKLLPGKFHYYTIEDYTDDFFKVIRFWTSRYLLVYNFESPDLAFHEIRLIDLFNDKSV